MPAPEPSLKFEDLLETVQESERGRWFIAEFAARLRKTETASIFAAINKLEGVITSQNQGGMDSVLVARARTAIATARREIANLDGSKQQLSDEARLFAKLADLARTAFSANDPGSPLVSAGVSRALLLVDQLDQDLAATPAGAETPGYFAPDAAVFEQPKIAAPAPAVIPPQVKPVVAEVERGARLLIRKAGETAATSAAIATPAAAAQHAETPPAPVSAPVPAAEATPADVTALVPPVPRQSRVVIIRRKPEELLDVPLVDDDTGATAA